VRGNELNREKTGDRIRARSERGRADAFLSHLGFDRFLPQVMAEKTRDGIRPGSEAGASRGFSLVLCIESDRVLLSAWLNAGFHATASISLA
jgi:hypothetical protein